MAALLCRPPPNKVLQRPWPQHATAGVVGFWRRCSVAYRWQSAGQAAEHPIRWTAGSQVNWDAIGAIAESIGALGVMISLVYLAVQIRQSGSSVEQNTVALRSSTYQSIVDAVANYNSFILQNERLAELTWKGRTEFDSLSENERRLFRVYLSNVLHCFSAAQYHFESGLLPKEEWYGFRNLLAAVFQEPGANAAWDELRPVFPPRFQELIARIQERQRSSAA
ncbi:MAG TPA: hypothetical protein VNI20_09315 [Fimbriimonadaceae bacterium]|nr:hypothetical protein [Fimbriimonadaceae bacterium]